MPELNEQQVALISAYIKQHGIAQDELHDDLLDHVCTSIERMMDENITFEEAFEHTIKLFGPGGLKQVQQQTFELLTEMNETMKRVTFSFGLASAFLLLAGTIFKLMHWPGAGPLAVISIFLLAGVYLPLVLRHKLKESPRNETLMHISGFIGLALTAVGVLFKIMHWPGAGVMLIGGMGILSFIYVPVYYIRKYKSSVNKPVTLSASLVAMSCLILVFALLNLNPSRRMSGGLLIPSQQLIDAGENNNKLTSLYDQLGDNDQADQLRLDASNLHSRIEEMKIDMVVKAENISREKAAKMDLFYLKSCNDYRNPTEYLFAMENEKPIIVNLLDELEQFEVEILGLYSDPVLKSSADQMLDFEFDQTYQLAGQEEDFATAHYYNIPLSSVLAQLSKFQLDIRTAETQALFYLLSQPAASVPPSGS